MSTNTSFLQAVLHPVGGGWLGGEGGVLLVGRQKLKGTRMQTSSVPCTCLAMEVPVVELHFYA